jgi:hypothetical protein
MHRFSRSAHAAGVGQSQEQPELSGSDIHRLLSILDRTKIDFTKCI